MNSMQLDQHLTQTYFFNILDHVYLVAEWFRALDLKSGGPWFKILHPSAIRICSR